MLGDVVMYREMGIRDMTLGDNCAVIYCWTDDKIDVECFVLLSNLYFYLFVVK